MVTLGGGPYLDNLAFCERQFVVDGVLIGRHRLRVVVKQRNEQSRLLWSVQLCHRLGTARTTASANATMAATTTPACPVVAGGARARRRAAIGCRVRVTTVVAASVVGLVSTSVARRGWSAMLPAGHTTAGSDGGVAVSPVLVRIVDRPRNSST